MARQGRLNTGGNYILYGGKTEERVLTAYPNCDPGRKCRQMLDAKRTMGGLFPFLTKSMSFILSLFAVYTDF